MQLDLSKDARQNEIVDAWQANNGKGTLLAVTGFGKTRTAIMGADRLCSSPNAKVQRTVLVVVPNLELESEWNENLKGKPYSFEVITIQTLTRRYSKNNKYKTSLLIADEIHRYTAEVFGTLFEAVDYNFIFGLSATIDFKDDKYQIIQEKAPIIDKVNLDSARENDWVSAFKIFNLGITMSSEEEKHYNKLSREFNKYFKTFDFDFGLAMDCMSNDGLRRRYANEIGWEEGAVMVHAVQFSRVVQARKKFLYELPSKLKLCKQIIDRFSDHIFITFSQSTSFADDLAEELGDSAVAFHSNLRTLIVDKDSGKTIAKAIKVKGKTRYKDDEGQAYTWKGIKEAYPDKRLSRKGSATRRKDALKRLKDGRTNIRVISTAKALDEGFNYPGINASIVSSGTSKTRQSIQRLGRMIRQQEGKIAFQVELYIKDTQDEKWLLSRQRESININWINSINEIIV